MQDIPDTVAETVEQFAELRGRTPEELGEMLVEIHNGNDDLDWDDALLKLRQRVIKEDSSGGGGGGGEYSTTRATVLTIGYDKVIEWEDTDVLLAHGVVRLEDTGKRSIASFLLRDNDGVNLGEAMDVFSEVGNIFSADVSVSNPNVASEGFVIYSAEGWEFEEPEEDIPRDARIEAIQSYTDEVTIADIANNPRQNLSLTNTDGWPADYGIDVKRIPSAILMSYYRNEDTQRGVYTIHDPSILDGSELEGTPLDNDSGHTAGLSCWGHISHIKYEDGGIGDVYGVIREDNNGQIDMTLLGIDPKSADPLQPDSNMGQETTETF